MVKSKKLSKSSLAVIVLSLLLILSMVVGMTAAWFTANAKQDAQSKNFGTIVINTTGTDVGFKDGDEAKFTEPLMPGDKVSAKVVVNNTGDEAYYVVKITISGVDGGNIDKWYVGTNKEASAQNMPTLAKGTGTVTIDQTITLDGTVYGNEYQTKSVSVAYEVRALQAKNITPAQAFAYLTAETFNDKTALSK